ncbi:Fic/DOC family protein [Pseudomonas trivialis]|uniref:protein adenylyltransferase n=1 Tax=Pseudomonas trivialis TaxID=200450 RepID=A0A0R2ZGE3_9PSED|nr:Fic family protein [Pseudomonas trivialis]KRP59850.1 hypothetical protein TU79_14555 [Pseudomonas trivialis]SDS15348.1 Fic/DOC family protein [Pseudomonas trivialis]
MLDKYGVGQDPYCYPGSGVLRNRLDLLDEARLHEAERELSEIAEVYGDLNVIHPFREGNGRAQRILFEQIIVNAGGSVNWWLVKDAAWIPANIDAVACDYSGLEAIFQRCISTPARP